MTAHSGLRLWAFLCLTGCGFDVPLGFDDAGPCGGAAAPGLGLRADPAFGTCGAVTHDIGQLDNVGFGTQGLAIDPQGRALLAGTTGTQGDRNVGVLRLLPSGAVDTSFGSAGVGEVSLTTLDQGHGVLVQPDGTILLAGVGQSFMAEPISLLGKLSADGQPELSFGLNGHAKAGTPGTCLGAWRRADGVVGCSGSAWASFPGPGDLALAALDGVTGAKVTTFANAGVALIDYELLDQNGAVAVPALDGKVLIPGWTAGATARDFALARVDSNGQLDPTFRDARGLPGRISVDFEGGDDECRVAFAAANGTVLCAGQARLSDGTVAGAMVRLLDDGSLDPSFGTGGRVVLRAWNSVWAVLPLADGRFLIGGDARAVAGDLAQALQVLDASGTEGSTLLRFDVTSADDSIRSLLHDLDGRTWAFGVANGGSGNGDWVVRRFVSAPPVRMDVGGACSSVGGMGPALAILWLLRAALRRSRR